MENLSKSFVALGKHLCGVKDSCEWCKGTEDVRPLGTYGNLCKPCRIPLIAALPTAEEAKPKRERSTAPVDPEKSGVIGWVRELIFRDEKISVVKLKGLMEEKGYAPATLNAQMARIKRAYTVIQDFIYLNQDCATKLKEVR